MPKFDDICKTVTATVIEALEQGIEGGWKKPWLSELTMPKNVTTGNFYKGINILGLWANARAKGYNSDLWATYKQWASIGAQVRKGEKATFGCYYGFNETEKNGKIVKTPISRIFWVFNADQVEGFKKESVENCVTNFDAIVTKTGAKICHSGDRACYIPKLDQINIPTKEAFTSKEGYFSTLFHELAHWTGAESRINRNLSNKFGDESYAIEELIAELSAAFTGAIVGMEIEVRKDHLQYIQNWIKVLKSDSKAIVKVANAAQKATDYILQ